MGPASLGEVGDTPAKIGGSLEDDQDKPVPEPGPATGENPAQELPPHGEGPATGPRATPVSTNALTADTWQSHSPAETPPPPSTEELLAELLVEVRQTNKRIGRIQFVVLLPVVLIVGLVAVVGLLAVLEEAPILLCLGGLPVLSLALLVYWVMKASPQKRDA